MTPTSAILRSERVGNLRWKVLIALALGESLAYMDRANLGVVVPMISAELHVDKPTMGFLLGSFFWSYALSQMAAGYLIDRFGVAILFPAAALLWSVTNISTAFVTGAFSLLAVRLMLGIAESPLNPSTVKVTAQWFPTRERAIATCIWDSGGRIGIALTMPIVATLTAAFGWRTAFIVTGLLGFVWLPFWLKIYRNPRAHKKLSPAELNYIEDGGARIETPLAPGLQRFRWVDLFRYRTVWGLMFGVFCQSFVSYWFLTWFPTYLVEARHFTLLAAGITGSIPGIAAIFGGWFGGFLSDYLLHKGFSLTAARKSCIVGGMLGGAVIAFAPLVEDPMVALALMSVSFFSLVAVQGSMWSLAADIAPSPRYVASLSSIQNTAAQAAGFAMPVFVGFAVQRAHGSYDVPLLVAGAMLVLGALCFIFVVGRVEPLPWPRKPLAELGQIDAFVQEGKSTHAD